MLGTPPDEKSALLILSIGCGLCGTRADDVETKRADPARIYVTGVSRGGHMTYTIACALADRIAGAAPAITGMTDYQRENCRPARPVPLMVVAGTMDLVTTAGSFRMAASYRYPRRWTTGGHRTGAPSRTATRSHIARPPIGLASGSSLGRTAATARACSSTASTAAAIRCRRLRRTASRRPSDWAPRSRYRDRRRDLGFRERLFAGAK